MNKKKRFEEMFNQMFPKVKSFARKILQSEEDAEDISQDVFVKLWNAPEIWEKDENWNSYIYTIARNLIYNHLKHQTVEQKFYQQADSETEYRWVADDIYNALYAKELRILIKLTVSHMPEQRRKCFYLSRQEEMSHAEIAEQLGISVRTVERHIHLALGDLKQATRLRKRRIIES